MEFRIEKALQSDLNAICKLFEEAIAFQKDNDYIGWKSYDQDFIVAEIQNGLLFKIIRNNAIACIFSICYSDPFIWRERENGDAIYLHRIVLNRLFQGEKMFKKVLEWAIIHSKIKALEKIRMDTWAENEKIIGYYKSYGFEFVENYTTANTDELPAQHRNLNVALLEFKIP
jgi:ribosomal protein S18 acetylase RimI-like enzyme